MSAYNVSEETKKTIISLLHLSNVTKYEAFLNENGEHAHRIWYVVNGHVHVDTYTHKALVEYARNFTNVAGMIEDALKDVRI